MALIRQLPGLYVRGSLVNVTIKNLNEEERKQVSYWTEYVANHEKMLKHKLRICHKLRTTIGADFKEPAAAEQEYYIAIWRGVADLLYHSSYQFQCAACGESTYTNLLGTKSIINRIMMPCPACNKVEITNPANTDFKPGDFVSEEDLKNTDAEFKSCIKAIPIQKHYQNGIDILKDPEQLEKLFSTFVFNYYLQQLRENKREEHKIEPQEVYGYPYAILTEEISSILRKNSIKHVIDTETTRNVIKFNTLQIAPEVTVEINLAINKYLKYGIAYSIATDKIIIAVDETAPMIKSQVLKQEHVKTTNFAPDDNILDGIGFRSHGSEKMDLENHVAMVESNDMLQTIRDSLPDDCIPLFEIMSQIGDNYQRYVSEYGYGQPCISNIAKMLNMSTKAVMDLKKTIKLACLKASV